MAVNPDFKDLFSAFNAAEARYLVVGAYAVIHYAEPIRILSLDDLVTAKRASGRKQDLLDLERLEAARRTPNG